MTSTAPMPWDRGAEQVEAMMHQGMPFACVEDLIDEAQLSRDQKGALWLLAWSLRDPLVQRQDARMMLTLVSRSNLRTH